MVRCPGAWDHLLSLPQTSQSAFSFWTLFLPLSETWAVSPFLWVQQDHRLLRGFPVWQGLPVKLCLCVLLIHSWFSSPSVMFVCPKSVSIAEVAITLVPHKHLAHCVQHLSMSEHVDSSLFSTTYPVFCRKTPLVWVSCLKVLVALIFIGLNLQRLSQAFEECRQFLPLWPRWVASALSPKQASSFWIMFSGHAFSTLDSPLFPRQAFCFQTLPSDFSSSELFSGFILRLNFCDSIIYLLFIIIFMSVCTSVFLQILYVLKGQRLWILYFSQCLAGIS